MERENYRLRVIFYNIQQEWKDSPPELADALKEVFYFILFFESLITQKGIYLKQIIFFRISN